MLEGLPLTLGALRAGGATFYYTERNMSVEQLLMAGRWLSVSTLRCYAQEAVCQLVWLEVDDNLRQSLQSFSEPGPAFLLSAPSVPWRKFISRKRQFRGKPKVPLLTKLSPMSDLKHDLLQ